MIIVESKRTRNNAIAMMHTIQACESIFKNTVEVDVSSFMKPYTTGLAIDECGNVILDELRTLGSMHYDFEMPHSLLQICRAPSLWVVYSDTLPLLLER